MSQTGSPRDLLRSPNALYRIGKPFPGKSGRANLTAISRLVKGKYLSCGKKQKNKKYIRSSSSNFEKTKLVSALEISPNICET